jgi:Aminotransferase class-III
MTVIDSGCSGSEFDTYARYTRPAVARLLRAFGLDVEFAAADGDHLLRSTDRAQRPVLDLVGGYGASMFGHHHPALVAALQEGLRARIPVNAQASVRPAAARLAERLSDLVGRETGDSYVVTFGCTGSDAVEAAMKHAAAERNRRFARILGDLSAARRRAACAARRRAGRVDLRGGSDAAARAFLRVVARCISRQNHWGRCAHRERGRRRPLADARAAPVLVESL